ncbi:MAG: trehalose-phosphatase [Rhizomicrobium sp.]
MAQDALEAPAGGGRICLPEIDLNRDAILLDIDGTLLDIASTPADVCVPDQLRGSLERLVSRPDVALALVSGRMLASIDSLFAPLKAAAVGCHGAQIRRWPDARIEEQVPPLPEAVRRVFSDIEAQVPRIRMEDKQYALSFHYRNAPEREAELCALLQERLVPFRSEYTIMRGKAVFEIVQGSCNKGEALRALMLRPPFHGRRPVFVGDDITDTFAFAVLGEWSGIGVSVGRRIPGADFMADTPRSVRRWLSRLADCNGDETNGHRAGP